MPLNEYIQQVNRALVNGALQFEPCQQALQQLLKELGPETDLDWQRSAGGPALILWHGQVAAGCIFTTPGDLDTTSENPQMQVWQQILPNVILTNFVEFRHGESSARLGTWQAGHIGWDRHTTSVENLLTTWATTRPSKISQADDLATLAALFAAQLRDAIQQSLTDESPDPALRDQYAAWPALSPRDFADQYARTLIFNLIAARLRHSGAARSQAFTMRDATWDQPPTNPVARALLRELEHLDSRVRWLLDLFVARLQYTDIAALRRELGRRSRQDTPLSRLYAQFCEVYDFTPPATEPSSALALYMVSSVHYLVQRRFKRTLGLADADVQITVPDVQDGTLAHFVLQQVHTTLRQQQQLGAWDSFVADDWLPRLFVNAPSLAVHAWIHLRLSLQLDATGYRFDSAQPLNVILPSSEQSAAIPWLQGAFAPLSPPTFPINAIIASQTDGRSFLEPYRALIQPGGIVTLLLPVDFLTARASGTARADLLHTFSDVYLLQMPTHVLALLVRRTDWSGDMARRVRYAMVNAPDVDAWLAENTPTSTEWQELYPHSPDYALQPPANGGSSRTEYEHGWRLSDIMPIAEPGISLENGSFIPGPSTQPVLVHPFDMRHFQQIPPVLKPMRRGDNLGLCVNNGCVLATDQLIHADFLGEQTLLFPLYVYPETAMLVSASPYAPGVGGRRPNLDSQFILRLAERLDMTFIPDGRGDNREHFGPEDVFYYLYAVLNSPTFTERYGRFFNGDLPRLPLPESARLFRNLTRLGRDLTRSHLFYRATNWSLATGFTGNGDSQIAPDHPRFMELAGEPGGRIHINRDKYFSNVEREIWNIHVGGVQVLREWLSAREAQRLTWQDVRYYQQIIVALTRAADTLSEIEEIFTD